MGRAFNQAPLPFMGQKRRFVKEFKTALNSFENNAIYVDLFGGSGLLSHTIRQEKPDVIVIYNDFDGYHKRIENVERTNSLLTDLRMLVVNLPKDKAIKEPYRSNILNRIIQEQKTGYVDYVTLSSSLLFSMNYANSLEELSKQTFYNTVKQTNYDATDYLNGIDIVSMDYRSLFEKWKHQDNVVFIIDPPYLSTEVGVYACYWKLSNFLDVLKTVRDTSYVYFTSNKSQIVDLCEWIERNLEVDNPFKGAKRVEIKSNTGYNSKYIDIMLFKH